MAVFASGTLISGAAFAGEEAFSTGPVFTAFGPAAAVETDFDIPQDMTLRTSFDVSRGADVGSRNRTFESAARFINMHVRAGMSLDKMKLAIVVHGSAVHDVAVASHYAEAVGGENANADLIDALIAKGVRIIVCGQSAAYYDVENAELLPGVEMALSAMTAHAVLQQQGYAVNPF
ncbi:MAG: DsrE family protein [Pseudomonadota bacterium]